MQQQIIFGTSVRENHPPRIEKPRIFFPGRCLTGQRGFSVDEGILSRHLMLVGGAGSGKTNTFQFAVEALRDQMGEEDFAIIFDTKGEFYELFSQPGDYVIGNSAQFYHSSNVWNLFDEILVDGWNELSMTLNARELAAALFHGRGSASQPFFCNAARDIFYGLLMHFLRQAKLDPAKWMPRLNNAALVKAIKQLKAEDYIKTFKLYPDTQYMLSYFGDGKSNQALGVFGELSSMVSEYFVGILAEHDPQRNISMRQLVREKGGKAIFVEYDLTLGETLAPVYRLLVDQALKEALGRTNQAGRVYLIADEFKLLPKLQHIDDALNFGRGLGVRVMAGIQSIDQLYDVYGKEKGAVLASGFGSIFAFHTNDHSSREYVTSRFGSNITAYYYNSTHQNTMLFKEREGNTVEVWDQTELGLGEAVVGLGDHPPFLFKFDEFRRG